jgi:hypothetical protein
MSGFIVGESLFNVALAGLIVLSGKGEPLAIANSLSESHHDHCPDRGQRHVWGCTAGPPARAKRIVN